MTKLVRFQCSHRPRLSCQSRLSANDKGDNEIKWIVHRSAGIYLTAVENPGIPSDKGCAVIRLK